MLLNLSSDAHIPYFLVETAVPGSNCEGYGLKMLMAQLSMGKAVVVRRGTRRQLPGSSISGFLHESQHQK